MHRRVTWEPIYHAVLYCKINVRFKSTLKHSLLCIRLLLSLNVCHRSHVKSNVRMTVPSAVGTWSGLLYTIICRYTYIRYLNINIMHDFPRTNQVRQWFMFFRLSDCRTDVSGKTDPSAPTSPVKYSCWTYLHNARLINSAFCSLKLCFGCVYTEINANNYPQDM